MVELGQDLFVPCSAVFLREARNLAPDLMSCMLRFLYRMCVPHVTFSMCHVYLQVLGHRMLPGGPLDEVLPPR